MQSVFDSICRCFGTAEDGMTDFGTFEESNEIIKTAGSSSPRTGQKREGKSSPDGKRRTRSLALKGKQWDALFSADQQHPQPTPTKSTQPKRVTPTRPNADSVEQATAVAKAKLASNIEKQSSGGRNRMHKRKRSTSRDEIFRTKKTGATDSTPSARSTFVNAACQPNPLSRFLSNHPVIANSLCFATPVRDSAEDEPDEVPLDNNSVMSDSNTLNTAEDTITSTLYYETTKLAGLVQKNPPMPLFNSFQVDERDEIRTIVATHSHSSVRMKDMYRQQMASGLEVVELEEDEEEDLLVQRQQQPTQNRESSPRKTSTNRQGRVSDHGADDIPPPMTHSSSDSRSSREAEV